jgi:hypothetical protein
LDNSKRVLKEGCEREEGIREMRKRLNTGWMFGFLFTFLISPSIGEAQEGDFLSKFHPYITVQEEYNDNIHLTNTNKIDDFITTVSPGLKFSALSEQHYGVDLDFRAGFVYYARDHDFNYFSPSGNLNAWYAMTPTLKFKVRDYLIRSDAAREQAYTANAPADQFLLSTQRGVHAIYIRNVVEPSVDYQFAKDGTISVLYRNNIYNNQNPLYEDSQENTINPKLTYWFDVNNGIALDYSLTFGTYERSPDQLGQRVTPRYTYRFNPTTSIFGRYSYERWDFKSPGIDYDVHNPSLGIEYKFSPTLSGTAEVGYFWQIPEEGTNTSGPSFNVSLTKSAKRTTYTLSFQGGYTEDYFTAQNRGFAKYYRTYGTISHQLLEKLTVGVTGSVERTTYSSNSERDWIYGIWGNASYPLLRWLSVSLQVGHIEDHSNISDLNYSQYRAIFSATAAF